MLQVDKTEAAKKTKWFCNNFKDLSHAELPHGASYTWISLFAELKDWWRRLQGRIHVYTSYTDTKLHYWVTDLYTLNGKSEEDDMH